LRQIKTSHFATESDMQNYTNQNPKTPKPQNPKTPL
jgi:hypothetical protein